MEILKTEQFSKNVSQEGINKISKKLLKNLYWNETNFRLHYNNCYIGLQHGVGSDEGIESLSQLQLFLKGEKKIFFVSKNHKNHYFRGRPPYQEMYPSRFSV